MTETVDDYNKQQNAADTISGKRIPHLPEPPRLTYEEQQAANWEAIAEEKADLERYEELQKNLRDFCNTERGRGLEFELRIAGLWMGDAEPESTEAF